MFDALSGTASKVLSVPYRLPHVVWLDEGSDVLVTALRGWFEAVDGRSKAEIWSVGVARGAVDTIVVLPGFQQELSPTLSPDGCSIAFVYDADNPVYDFLTSIGVVTTNRAETCRDAAGEIRRLTHDAKFRRPTWAPDGMALYALRSYGAFQQVYRIDAENGGGAPVTNGSVDIAAFALSPNGQRVAWMGKDAHGTFRIGLSETDGSGARQIIASPVSTEDLHLGEVREISWLAPDGLAIRGLLALPLDYQQGVRYPLIVDIHGGSWGSQLSPSGSLLGSPLEWQMWAAKGYATFAPDYRTTAAYGWRAVVEMREQQDAMDRDMDDILSGVDTLIAMGIVDPTQMAVYGHSGGAIHTNWIVARTRNRFRAAVSYEGLADEYLLSGVGANAGRGNENLAWLYRGWPWDVPEHYLKNSAVFQAKGATTPTLFLMGDPSLGSADATLSVQFLYTALKKQLVETKYVRYPDEGHVCYHPANCRDILLRSVEWIDTRIRTSTQRNISP